MPFNSDAETALARLFEHSTNPRIRARALWLLGSGSISRDSSRYIARAATDTDPDIRSAAVRVARQVRAGLGKTVESLVHDPAPEVRRDCAIAVRNMSGPQRAALWAQLAAQYDGRDRWYLEALGIGAEGDWDACLAAWLNKVGSAWDSPAGRDIVWRSRATKTAGLLAEILKNSSTPASQLPRFLRAFDFLHGPEKERALVDLAFGDVHRDAATSQLVMADAIERLDRQDVLNDPAHAAALKQVVAAARGTRQFVDLIERFGLRDYSGDLLALAQANSEDELGVRAVQILLSQRETTGIAAALKSADSQIVESTIRVLGSAQDPRADRLLTPVVEDKGRPIDLRRQSLQAVARTKAGAARILAQAEAGKLDEGLREAASAALHGSPVEEIRARADKLFPLRAAADAKPLPSIKQLTRRTGDPRAGRIVFATTGTCAKCHVVNGEGKDVGPNLSEIGAKLSRQALYESILFPSAGISHNFAAYTLVLQSGNVVSGILTSRTADSIAIKGIDAITRTYAAAEVEELKEQPISLMPADLQKAMTANDIVNVVEYLTTLKPAPAANDLRNKKSGRGKEAARLP
jgi:putative heme-binding domain-containing protein